MPRKKLFEAPSLHHCQNFISVTDKKMRVCVDPEGNGANMNEGGEGGPGPPGRG
jgi:hypothetical protein